MLFSREQSQEFLCLYKQYTIDSSLFHITIRNWTLSLIYTLNNNRQFNNQSILNMSTLAAARADNFYISKNYDPKNIKPTKKQLAEQKPFVVVQGERVGGGKVRYQTPFHVRCQGCSNMVAKGVRFNAIKTWVGNFHSTKIYQFRMKCPQCVQRFVVRTDPQNCEYLYVSGAKRIFQAKDCTDQSRIRDQEAQQANRQDPFSKLQAQYQDKQIYGKIQQTIEKIKESQQRGLEDFQLNRMLRKKVRLLKQDQAQYLIQKRSKNMFIPLLKQQKEDDLLASSIKFKKTKPIFKKEQQGESQRDKLKQKMKRLNPLFKKQLKKEILQNNKPKSSVFLKK